jgi:predicted RNase H-like nuclease
VSTEPALYVGADRCEAGWVAVAYTEGGFDHAAVFAETGGLWGRYEETAERLLIDVPIGLRESSGEPRPPEQFARAVLGPLRRTVVDPPVREAALKQRYATANRVHERKTGNELSRAAYERAGAVTELDSLLGAIPEARDLFAEANPEVCFRAFAGAPLEQPKATAAGYAERLRTLAGFDADAPVDVVSTAEATAGHTVRVHDVLDATALALTARPGPGKLRSAPESPQHDAEGLPMQLHYRSETPLDDA